MPVPIDAIGGRRHLKHDSRAVAAVPVFQRPDACAVADHVLCRAWTTTVMVPTAMEDPRWSSDCSLRSRALVTDRHPLARPSAARQAQIGSSATQPTKHTKNTRHSLMAPARTHVIVLNGTVRPRSLPVLCAMIAGHCRSLPVIAHVIAGLIM